MNQEAVKLLKRKLFGNYQNKRVITGIVSIFVYVFIGEYHRDLQ